MAVKGGGPRIEDRVAGGVCERRVGGGRMVGWAVDGRCRRHKPAVRILISLSIHREELWTDYADSNQCKSMD